ncbi:beta-defensin 129-like isoform X2 [Tupaia chinensis]|uniref:beta-defensin 129-like isoform X2 n=1 Tax=Tupaia chinensis TaxID=246437 RepID=UPI000703FE4A|nr:beta-defensin 129-like isoform X2 [Tupaia chinensis]
MKLLFPLFASFMLQNQVNTEFLIQRRCLLGFGKCKGSCNANEKEIQKCKKEICCLGPKVVQLIKSYLRHEIPNVLGEDTPEMLKMAKNSSPMMQSKHMLSVLSKNKISPFDNTNSAIPNVTPINSTITSAMTPRHIRYAATSTKSDIKKSRDSAIASPPPQSPRP